LKRWLLGTHAGAVSGQVDNRRSRLGSYNSGDSVGGRAHGGISHIESHMWYARLL
jgi:hypothetical protein